jgi:superfamily II DNA/RNA helicase
MQQRAIRSGVHILVATPGRALDHISRGTIDLSNVKHVVLDEVIRYFKSCLSFLIEEWMYLVEYAC